MLPKSNLGEGGLFPGGNGNKVTTREDSRVTKWETVVMEGSTGVRKDESQESCNLASPQPFV